MHLAVKVLYWCFCFVTSGTEVVISVSMERAILKVHPELHGHLLCLVHQQVVVLIR